MSTKPPLKPTEKPASTLEWLLQQVESYLLQNPHITPQGFGWRAIRQTSLVDRLRAGKDVTTRKLDALIKYMSNPNEKGSTNGNQSKAEKKRK